MSTGNPTQADRGVPPELELIRAFVNTFDVETGEESLTSPDVLERWLADRGLAPAGSLGSGDLERAIAFREALRALLLANNGEQLAGPAHETLRAAASDSPLRVEIDGEGRAVLAPASTGVGELVARILAAAAEAQAEGTWDRLKACPAGDCHWAFYDQSRNRSRTWCSMDVCGNRKKTRSYRARKAEGG